MQSDYILIVDDNPAVRETVSDVLELEGFDVHQASDGAQALALIRTNQYRLVFCDISMPEMTGLELLEQLQSSSTRPPIYMLSAMTERDTIATALSLGAAGYVTKPFSPEDLLEVLGKH